MAKAPQIAPNTLGLPLEEGALNLLTRNKAINIMWLKSYCGSNLT